MSNISTRSNLIHSKQGEKYLETFAVLLYSIISNYSHWSGAWNGREYGCKYCGYSMFLIFIWYLSYWIYYSYLNYIRRSKILWIFYVMFLRIQKLYYYVCFSISGPLATTGYIPTPSFMSTHISNSIRFAFVI